MKAFSFTPLLVLVLALMLATPALLPGNAAAQTDLRAMTFNIRFATESDGEHAWSRRKDLAASVIRFHQPDLVGLQEALLAQIEDLVERLPDYAWVGVGRDDGASAGEFSAIMYRADRFTAREWGTFWLSETPEVPGSKSWDAAITRIVTWVLFDDEDTGNSFYHFNTHFDHVGTEARLHSAHLILERLRARAYDTLAVVVTGDFNFEPTAEPYAVLSDVLLDAREMSGAEPHGPEGTFSGFVATREPMPRIDYIFVTSGITVERYATLAEHWNGRHASDHLPVVADVRLP